MLDGGEKELVRVQGNYEVTPSIYEVNEFLGSERVNDIIAFMTARLLEMLRWGRLTGGVDTPGHYKWTNLHRGQACGKPRETT